MKTPRERILATFRHENDGPLVYQPRIYYWYGENVVGSLEPVPAEEQPSYARVPSHFRGKTMLEVYDAIGASPRYAPEVLGLSPFGVRLDETRIHVRHRDENGTHHVEFETPAGTLSETLRAGYHSEFLLKTPRDFAAYRHVLDASTFYSDPEAFAAAERAFGDRGVVQTYFPRAPLQRCFIEIMGFEPTIYALMEHPGETQELLDAIAEWDNQMYDVICASPLQILNFGENIDVNMDSPPLFREHLAPYYTRRLEQLHAAGKLAHIHADGSLKGLLKLIADCGFDGIEAATPLPQGDVSIEEIKEALGDTLLLDGIPAIAFLPSFPRNEFEAITRKVIETFAPNLICGISDELPPGGDMERVVLAGEMARAWRA